MKAALWAVTGNCSISTPVYPSHGGSYGFGYKVMNPGLVLVTIASNPAVGFSKCGSPDTPRGIPRILN